MPKDFSRLRLLKILQRLKSLILHHLTPAARTHVKTQLQQLDENYSKHLISFDQYKINSTALLCSYWSDITRVEQFLYRETGNFFTQAEKFTICQFSQKFRD